MALLSNASNGKIIVIKGNDIKEQKGKAISNGNGRKDKSLTIGDSPESDPNKTQTSLKSKDPKNGKEEVAKVNLNEKNKRRRQENESKFWKSFKPISKTGGGNSSNLKVNMGPSNVEVINTEKGCTPLPHVPSTTTETMHVASSTNRSQSTQAKIHRENKT